MKWQQIKLMQWLKQRNSWLGFQRYLVTMPVLTDCQNVTLVLAECDTGTVRMWQQFCQCDTGTVRMWHQYCQNVAPVLSVWHRYYQCDTGTVRMCHRVLLVMRIVLTSFCPEDWGSTIFWNGGTCILGYSVSIILILSAAREHCTSWPYPYSLCLTLPVHAAY